MGPPLQRKHQIVGPSLCHIRLIHNSLIHNSLQPNILIYGVTGVAAQRNEMHRRDSRHSSFHRQHAVQLVLHGQKGQPASAFCEIDEDIVRIHAPQRQDRPFSNPNLFVWLFFQNKTHTQQNGNVYTRLVETSNWMVSAARPCDKQHTQDRGNTLQPVNDTVPFVCFVVFAACRYCIKNFCGSRAMITKN
jgi:hypothetical protein